MDRLFFIYTVFKYHTVSEDDWWIQRYFYDQHGHSSAELKRKGTPSIFDWTPKYSIYEHTHRYRKLRPFSPLYNSTKAMFVDMGTALTYCIQFQRLFEKFLPEWSKYWTAFLWTLCYLRTGTVCITYFHEYYRSGSKVPKLADLVRNIRYVSSWKWGHTRVPVPNPE